MIKTTITKQPTVRAIYLECPTCKTNLIRKVKFDQRKGNDECGLCYTKFEWEETEDNIG